MTVPVVASDRHRGHDPDREIWHGDAVSPYEFPERAEIIRAALAADGTFTFHDLAEHGTAPLDAVHEPGMVRYLEDAWREWLDRAGERPASLIPDTMLHPAIREGMGSVREPGDAAGRIGYWCFETMTPITEGSYDAARAAADVALTAVDLVLGGERLAFGLCRPPGHHAARAAFGGYCFLNNAAVAAQYAVERTGARVAVLDVDYHHGNGTQQIFYQRADVLYASLHGDPTRAYPYFAGYREETGAGAGLGTTCNWPLPAGCDDERWLGALDEAIDAVAAFGPDLIVVSLGVDTFEGDPLGDFAVSADGLEEAGRRVATAGVPLVVLQEGGYAVAELGENVRRWLRGAVGVGAP